jgi:uncharacterized protein (DUF302 family)
LKAITVKISTSTGYTWTPNHFKIAVKILNTEPRLGSLMPCRITVFQQGKEAVVTTILPSLRLTLLPEKSEVKQAVARVDRELRSVIDAATR